MGGGVTEQVEVGLPCDVAPDNDLVAALAALHKAWEEKGKEEVVVVVEEKKESVGEQVCHHPPLCTTLQPDFHRDEC
jgi:hypothetical protein